MDYKNRGN